jgi:hypothetical protein
VIGDFNSIGGKNSYVDGDHNVVAGHNKTAHAYSTPCEIIDEICLVQPSGGLGINAHPAHARLRKRAPESLVVLCQRHYR